MNKGFNKTIRQFLIVSSVALALPAAALASPGEGCEHDGRAGHHEKFDRDGGKHGGPERMFKKLDLTAEQQIKAKALFEEHHSQMRTERTAFMAKMDAILTPAQREKAQAMRAKHEERMKERRERKDDDS